MTTPTEPIDYFDEELGEWISPEDHEIITMLQGMTLEQLKALKADVGKDLAAHRLKILDRAIEAAESAEMAAILEKVQQELATPKQAKASKSTPNWLERIKVVVGSQAKPKLPPPAPFTTPYFNESINEMIDTQELHDLVVKIDAMGLKELDEFLKDIQTDVAINPAYGRTKECRVSCNAIIRGCREAEKRGERLVTREPLDPCLVVEAIMHGYIEADEFCKRTGTW